MLFFGDDHGGEAVVGRRDAYWANGGPTVTNSLLLYLFFGRYERLVLIGMSSTGWNLDDQRVLVTRLVLFVMRARNLTLGVSQKNKCFQSVGPVHLYRRETISMLHSENLSF